jgi:hypothetical protein
MDKKVVHVHDLAAPGGEFPEGREDALKLGHRSILAVPLVLKSEGIGTMIVRRFEVRPFSDRQIARRPGCHRDREHAAVRGGAG